MTLGRLSIQVFANFVGLGSNDRLIIRDVKVLSWSAWLIWCHWLLYSSLLAPGYFWEGRAWWYPLTSASFPILPCAPHLSLRLCFWERREVSASHVQRQNLPWSGHLCGWVSLASSVCLGIFPQKGEPQVHGESEGWTLIVVRALCLNCYLAAWCC